MLHSASYAISPRSARASSSTRSRRSSDVPLCARLLRWPLLRRRPGQSCTTLAAALTTSLSFFRRRAHLDRVHHLCAHALPPIAMLMPISRLLFLIRVLLWALRRMSLLRLRCPKYPHMCRLLWMAIIVLSFLTHTRWCRWRSTTRALSWLTTFSLALPFFMISLLRFVTNMSMLAMVVRLLSRRTLRWLRWRSTALSSTLVVLTIATFGALESLPRRVPDDRCAGLVQH
mmetsp:Transcript_28202/g.77856  ORF Transcript_28202/g.77856 Transcript_28202/m.77856 type:complete len:230 (+) Transcript_28202:224-913(+)